MALFLLNGLLPDPKMDDDYKFASVSLDDGRICTINPKKDELTTSLWSVCLQNICLPNIGNIGCLTFALLNCLPYLEKA
jgi:hypothetical protein